MPVVRCFKLDEMVSSTVLDLSLRDSSLVPLNAHRPDIPFYPTLDSSRDEVRLLEIVSCSKCLECRVECELITYSLDDDLLPYMVLLYVWGDPNDTKLIHVNELEIEVTSNLADALLQTREDCLIHIL